MRKPGKKTKSQKSPRPAFGQRTTVSHHRKSSSNNTLEDIKGVLRDELLSIDFTDEEAAQNHHF